MQRTCAIVLMIVGLLAATALAEDWPQFLGPDRNGVSRERGLLDGWPDEGPKELWRKDLGPGFGGAAIRDGEVFLLDRIEDEADVLRCLDLRTGEEKWRYEYEAEGRLSHNGSRSVPTVTDEHVFTVGGFGDVHCISRETHEPVWQIGLNEAYEEARLSWGFAQSPLLYQDSVILTPPHGESPGLVALEQETGEVVWESEPFGGNYYSSPILREVAGRLGVMIVTNDRVTFIDPDTGETIWRYAGWNCQFPIPAPTVLPDGEHIFITGGYDAGSVMIHVEEQGGDYEFEEVFRLDEGSQIHPAIHHEGHLYANINENSNLRGPRRANGGLACIDPRSGEILWRTGEEPSLDRGNFIFADGNIIALEGEEGELFLIDPSPRGYEEISSFTALEPKQRRGNKVWAPMALSDGLLVVRDQQEMKCFDLRGRRATARADRAEEQ